MNTTDERILDALTHLRREVRVNGLTPEADDLWRSARELRDLRDREPVDEDLPALLQHQAD